MTVECCLCPISGIPTLAYGIGSWLLVRHHEDVQTSLGSVRIYFLLKEENEAKY